MKRSTAATWSFLLTLTAVTCTVGALITAFSFGVNIGLLVPVCLIAALAFAVAATLTRSKGILILLLPALALFVRNFSEIAGGAKGAVHHITAEYSKWLHVPVLFPGSNATMHELTMFFAALCVLLAALLSISICLKHSAYLSFSFTAPLVFLTIVLTVSTPDVRYLLGLLVVHLTLAIGSFLHPVNYDKRAVSVFRALMLAMLLLLAAYLVAPQTSYRRSALIHDFDIYIRKTASRLGLDLNKAGVGWPASVAGEWRFNTDFVRVSAAGSRSITDQSMLTISTTQPGVFYLRGFSMLSFDGMDWHGSSETYIYPYEGLAKTMPAQIIDAYRNNHPRSLPARATMNIERTGDSTNIIYRPYYVPSLFGSAGNQPVISSQLGGASYLQQPSSDSYSIDFDYSESGVFGMHKAMSRDDSQISELVRYNLQVRAPSIYTGVDETTAEGLLKIALDAGIDPTADRASVADMVAEFISSSASYTHTPYVIPEDEDFALYFLSTSKLGYCIHFATAATLMLRAMDIPARITCGFIVTVVDENVGSTITVTDRNAHAWVEVYYDDVGWLPLEVTPSGSRSGVPARTPHTATIPAITQTDNEPALPSDPYADLPMEYFLEYEMNYVTPSLPSSPVQAGSYGESENLGLVGVGMLIVFSVAGFIAALALRREMQRRMRVKSFAQKDANAAVIFAWKYINDINLRDEYPPAGLEELALKARFSRHKISEAERTMVLDKVNSLSDALEKHYSLKWKIWFKYIKALM